MTTKDMNLECYGMNLEASEKAHQEQNQFPIFKGHKKTKFYVMVVWADAPKRSHKKLSDAKIEAQRLAKLTGKPTLVLQCLKKYETGVSEVSYKKA